MDFLNHDPEAGSQPDACAGLPAPPASNYRTPEQRRTLAGLLVRKECWQLSVRGKILALLILVGALFAVQNSIYPWLAVTHRVSGQYLVVEGWIYNSGFKEAMAEFNKGGYRKILTSGCVVQDPLDFDGKVTYADWGAVRLRKLGMSKALVQPIPCWVEQKDRTYYSAVAVNEWFLTNHIIVKSINVLTQGPHARRTRLLFQEAFGNEVKVGIIAVQDPAYDPKHWWRSSEGVRDVIGEGIAYLYAKFLFWPSSE
jgi:hypothetical protein